MSRRRISRSGARGTETRARGGHVGQYATMPTLVVSDQGQPISICFDDLLKYHGRSSIAGLAHAFKAMERGFPFLSPLVGRRSATTSPWRAASPGEGRATPSRWSHAL